MKIFKTNEDGWLCGYWNDSPVQIKYSNNRPITQEELHKHEFREYYLMIDGSLTLEINSKKQTLSKLELLMIEPEESHKIIEKSGNCVYIIIKERSYKDNKK
jgi:mannose-6-phosphate isomerase-like protein (cupin superfamily)